MKIAIVGAGAVALSSAALVTQKGHQAWIWSAFQTEVEKLQSSKLVFCEGDINGSFAIEATREIQECITGAEVVMIAAPAFAHQELIAACAPHIQPDHTVVMNTATGFSSLFLSRVLAERNVRPTIVDLATTVRMARIVEPGRVRLGPSKPGVDLATLPAARSKNGHATLTKLFGDVFVVRNSTLAISLNNHNPIYHIPAFLFNLPRVERGEEWNIWHNITPLAARYMQKLDNERMAVAKCFGVDAIPLVAYIGSSMGLAGDDLATLFAAAALKRPAPTGPRNVEDRYITEDIPYGMVFFRTLGAAGNVPMPVSDHLIEFCSDLYGRNFRIQGIGLDELGLSGRGPAGIYQIAREGF